MKILTLLTAAGFTMLAASCAHNRPSDVSPEEAARFDRNLVRETVVFEANTKSGATVPDVSSPQLRAVWIPERVEGNRLIEAHREWILEGDVSILGIPKQSGAKSK